jgi:hypothetical protein
VSTLDQVTAHAQFAHFNPHHGSAAAAEEEVTGRQGGRSRESGKVIPKDPTADPTGQRESICNGKQGNNCYEKPEIPHQVSEEEDSDYSDMSDEFALIRDVNQLKVPVVSVECGSVTLLSLVFSIRVMLEILVETTA